jgi:hypothetical protein
LTKNDRNWGGKWGGWNRSWFNICTNVRVLMEFAFDTMKLGRLLSCEREGQSFKGSWLWKQILFLACGRQESVVAS